MTHRLRQKAAGLLAALLMALGIGFTAAAPASAATVLGGVSMQSWCDNAIAPGLTATIVSWNAYGWRCVVGSARYSINVDQQCGWQYGAGAYSRYLNYNDPYSWRCYR